MTKAANRYILANDNVWFGAAKPGENDMDHRAFMTKKYYSMLAGGTITCVIVAVLMLSDALIAGVMIGEKAVAAVNLIMPVYSLASFFAMVFTLGEPILYSNAMGRFQKEEADRVFAVGIAISAGSGILLFLLLMLFGDHYLAFYRASAEIQAQAADYLAWMRWVFLFMPLNSLACAMVFTDGDEGLSTAAGFSEAAGKLAFSILLCGRIGIAGLGLGSLIGESLSLLLCLGHFFRKGNSLKPGIAFSWKLLISIIRFSVIDAGTYLFLSVFTAGLNKFVIACLGAQWLILVSVVAIVKELALVFDGIGESITPIMSIYLAEECYAGVRKLWKLARRTAILEGVAAAVLLFAFAEMISRCLGITDPGMLQTAAAGLRMMSIGLPFLSVLYLIAAYYLLADRIPLGLFITALRDVAVGLPFAVLGGWIGGVYGMLACVALSSAAAYLVALLYLFLRYGRDNYPLLLKEKEQGKQSFLFDFEAIPDRIAAVREEVRRLLEEFRFSSSGVNRLLLVFEELFMMIHDQNAGRRVFCECSLLVEGTHLKLVSWDDGKLFDLTQTDRKPDSLRAYVVSRVLSGSANSGRNLVALSFNRNLFEIEMDSGAASPGPSDTTSC